MRKFISFVLWLVFIVAIAIVVLGVVEPRDVPVQRNTFIKAPKSLVFDQMVNFKNWVHWSPWYQMDTSAQITYMGNDGQPGSSFHWVGDPKRTGEWDIKDTAVKDGEMDYQMQMSKPFNGIANGFIRAEDAGNGMTKATWGFTMHFSFPWNAVLVFMNMDRLLGGDFDKGLQNMKKYTEAITVNNTAAQIQEIQYPAHTFEGIRKTMSMSEMEKFFADSYSQIGKVAGSAINGSAVGIFYTWDTVKHVSDMAAAFPVSDTSKPVNGGSCIYIPQSKAYMAVHKGGYASMGSDHAMLMKYIADKGQKQNVVIEEYVVGPYQEKDSTKWVTNIYYLVQ